MNLVLQRLRQTDDATFGQLMTDRGTLGILPALSLVTLEHCVSCIQEL